MMSLDFESRELSPSTWVDFERLFEKHGGVQGGCWCMFYHVTEGWSKRSPQQNRAEKHTLVNDGKAHGVLVYHEGKPVGWCQFGPANELPRIDNMRRYKPSREQELWRITCFFTDRDYRRNGVAREALKSALYFMKERGVRVVEAYPVDVRKRRSTSMLWSGTPGLFEAAGFTRVGRLGKNQWVFEKRL